MKELVKTSRTIGYLEKIFRTLNEKYFNGVVEEPIFTIQPTPKAYGHVTAFKTWLAGDSTRRELNIGAGTINRPIEDVVATILHEMVHLFNLQNDIKDTSRGNTYHNKNFKRECEKRDLQIEYNEKIGWSNTSPTEKLMDFIIEMQWQDILIKRQEICDVETKKTSKGSGENIAVKKSSTRKYVCPACGQSVRATKELNILCMDCDQKMILEF